LGDFFGFLPLARQETEDALKALVKCRGGDRCGIGRWNPAANWKWKIWQKWKTELRGCR